MLEGFETATRCYRGITRTVYRRGEGPGVLVMHEIPGITPQVAAFARTVADAGFRVELPQLFGTPNKEIGGGYVLGQMARACISRETRPVRSPSGCGTTPATCTPRPGAGGSERSACA